MRLFTLILGLCLLSVPSLAEETYETFFREGALSGVHEGETLTYRTRISGWSAPGKAAEAPKVREGSLSLTLSGEDVVMNREREGAEQSIGTFPASVGNPIIMYFLETTLRDMATQAGGSPFYIRNRIKDALLRSADRETVTVTYGNEEITAERATIHPFTTDKARGSMGGFADLSLAVTVSEDVPGWYLSLTASAPSVAGREDEGYRSGITLHASEGETQ